MMMSILCLDNQDDDEEGWLLGYLANDNQMIIKMMTR